MISAIQQLSRRGWCTVSPWLRSVYKRYWIVWPLPMVVSGHPVLAYVPRIEQRSLAYSYPFTESGSYANCKNIPEYVSGLSVVGYDRTSEGDENAMMNYVSVNGPSVLVYANDRGSIMFQVSCPLLPVMNLKLWIIVFRSYLWMWSRVGGV